MECLTSLKEKATNCHERRAEGKLSRAISLARESGFPSECQVHLNLTRMCRRCVIIKHAGVGLIYLQG